MMSDFRGGGGVKNDSKKIICERSLSSDEVFSKILKEQSIVQKKIISLMKAKVVFIGKKNSNEQNIRDS